MIVTVPVAAALDPVSFTVTVPLTFLPLTTLAGKSTAVVERGLLAPCPCRCRSEGWNDELADGVNVRGVGVRTRARPQG